LLVPGIPKGPGGVIVCCEDKLVYKTEETTLEVGYPKRIGTPGNKGLFINCFTTHVQGKKVRVFYFLCLSSRKLFSFFSSQNLAISIK